MPLGSHAIQSDGLIGDDTVGFSRKIENHAAMLAVWMYVYNFVQPHRSLTRKGGPPTTPAMAAGVADWRRKIEDVVELLDARSESHARTN